MVFLFSSMHEVHKKVPSGQNDLSCVMNNMMFKKNPFLFLIRPSLIFFFVLFSIGLTIYSNVLLGEFCSDDYPLLVDNPGIRDWRNLREIWHTAPTRFLVVLSFALNYHWGGLVDVWGYHLVNILLHVGCAFLVYRFFEITRLTPALREQLPFKGEGISRAAALLFLTHPIATQAVSFITQRGTLLSTLFYLLTLIGYSQYRLLSPRATQLFVEGKGATCPVHGTMASI